MKKQYSLFHKIELHFVKTRWQQKVYSGLCLCKEAVTKALVMNLKSWGAWHIFRYSGGKSITEARQKISIIWLTTSWSKFRIQRIQSDVVNRTCAKPQSHSIHTPNLSAIHVILKFSSTSSYRFKNIKHAYFDFWIDNPFKSFPSFDQRLPFPTSHPPPSFFTSRLHSSHLHSSIYTRRYALKFFYIFFYLQTSSFANRGSTSPSLFLC